MTYNRYTAPPRIANRILWFLAALGVAWTVFAVAVYGELNQCAVDLSPSDWRPMPGEVEPPPEPPRKRRYVIVTNVRGVPLTLTGSL